jgi:protein gp37
VWENKFLSVSVVTYLLLTKRAERMARWLHSVPKALLNRVDGHLWLGVSVEDRQRANERLPLLIENWPGRRVACLEPLLGGIDLCAWIERIDWVITGGETGAGGRKPSRSTCGRCVTNARPLVFRCSSSSGAAAKTNSLQTHWTVKNGEFFFPLALDPP